MRRCLPPDLCIGTSCQFQQVSQTPDGTPYVSGASYAVGGGTCHRAPWPAHDCAETLIPTRKALIDAPADGYAFFVIGFGSRIASMLAVAAHSLLHGFGFQMSSHACGFEQRWQPHCFFQPVSACGRHATHVCTDVGPGVIPRGKQMGNCVPGTKTPLNRRLMHLPSWGRLSGSNLTHMCRLLVARAHEIEERGSGQLPPIEARLTLCDQPQVWTGSRTKATGGLLAYRLLARTVLRVQPELQVSIDDGLLSRFPWLREGRRFGAVHIRRRDKITAREARVIPICMYAERLATLSSSAVRLPVFVATDDFRTLESFRRCAPVSRLGWVVHTWPEGEPARGANASVVLRLWSEVQLMVRASWAVVTFTSNVGRLVQLLRTQRPATLWSIDTAQKFVIPPDRPFVVFSVNATADQQTVRRQQRRQQLVAGKQLQLQQTQHGVGASSGAHPWAAFLPGHGAQSELDETDAQ